MCGVNPVTKNQLSRQTTCFNRYSVIYIQEDLSFGHKLKIAYCNVWLMLNIVTVYIYWEKCQSTTKLECVYIFKCKSGNISSGDMNGNTSHSSHMTHVRHIGRFFIVTKPFNRLPASHGYTVCKNLLGVTIFFLVA